jgi:hypothetical protein
VTGGTGRTSSNAVRRSRLRVVVVPSSRVSPRLDFPFYLRPLYSIRPSHSDPLISSGLFGLPDTRYPLASSYVVQPETLPILSTLSTTPDARHWLRYLREGVKELRRTRAGVLREYTEGEHGVGREGIEEALERVEGLIDAYGGEDEEDQDEGEGEDEDWSATEPKEEEFDFDLE